MLDPIDRIMYSFAISEKEFGGSPCWDCINTTCKNGYGRLSINGIRGIAHRVSYQYLVGSIPSDLEIDHLCKNRRCINPEHMELVSHKENNMRSDSPTSVNKRKTHCSAGHEFTIQNTYYRKNGGRDCKRCHANRELIKYSNAHT